MLLHAFEGLIRCWSMYQNVPRLVPSSPYTKGQQELRRFFGSLVKHIRPNRIVFSKQTTCPFLRAYGLQCILYVHESHAEQQTRTPILKVICVCSRSRRIMVTESCKQDSPYRNSDNHTLQHYLAQSTPETLLIYYYLGYQTQRPCIFLHSPCLMGPLFLSLPASPNMPWSAMKSNKPS